VKKREGSDVIEVKINVSKTQKETGRDYKFSKTHQTAKVAFYDYNPYEGEGVKHLLVEVPIEKIASNSYSLNYAEYIKDETEEEQYEDSIVVKRLGEVCEIEKNLKKYDTSHGKSEGKYKFHTGGERTDLYVDECDIKDLYIIQNRTNGSGKCNLYLDKNFSLAKQTIAYRALNKEENTTKYIYYYLLFNKELLEKGFIGANHKNISKEYISNIKIPIPSLERQQEIVKYLDFIYEKANKTSNEKIAELKQFNEFCLTNQKLFGENVVKGLGEVCSIDYGTRIVKGNNTEGEYPVYGSGRAMFSTNTFNREGYNILIGRFALSLECVRFVNDNIFLNDSGLSVKPKTDSLLHKYIGYYLLHNQSIIYNCARGTAQKNLEMDIFKSIKIPIPSLERQQEIVAYCEFNDALIRQLEMEIENNKKQAQMFIDGIVKSQGQIRSEELPITSPEDHDEVNSVVSSASSSSAVSLTETKPKTRKFIVKKSLP
jgi:restriction endonuclease S subunit